MGSAAATLTLAAGYMLLLESGSGVMAVGHAPNSMRWLIAQHGSNAHACC